MSKAAPVAPPVAYTAWVRLGRGVGVASDAKKLILALLGLVLFQLGRGGLDQLFSHPEPLLWQPLDTALPAPIPLHLPPGGIPFLERLAGVFQEGNEAEFDFWGDVFAPRVEVLRLRFRPALRRTIHALVPTRPQSRLTVWPRARAASRSVRS